MHSHMPESPLPINRRVDRVAGIQSVVFRVKLVFDVIGRFALSGVQNPVIFAVGPADHASVPGLSSAERVENRLVEFDPLATDGGDFGSKPFLVAIVVVGSSHFRHFESFCCGRLGYYETPLAIGKLSAASFEDSVTNRMNSKLCIAPMMDWTDRHCRYFFRLLSPSAFLYTEMVTAAAIHHGNADRFLSFSEEEHPVALQLGGSNPEWMASATRKAAAYGYDEININVGCPSDRVQSGQFGACLMAHPETVAECLKAMQAETAVPVTVKTRIGIDNDDNDEFLHRFVERIAAAGCRKFIVHARIAILEGLSPKDNRSIPPLNYDRVYRLKRDFPELEVVINGGLTSIEQVDAALEHVDGAMIGRQAYHQPYLLAELESHFNPGRALPVRHEIVHAMLPYVESVVAAGEPLQRVTRHMLGLYAGQPGARAWRRYISEHAHRPDAGIEVLINAVNAMPIAA